MKRIMTLCMAVMLIFSAGIAKAQDVSTMSDKDLSAQYKGQMDVLKSEIKTLKLKLKTDKENPDLKAEVKQKTEDLTEVKDKKAVIDKAIKSKKASEKATQKADKAQRDAEKAAKAASQVKENEKKN